MDEESIVAVLIFGKACLIELIEKVAMKKTKQISKLTRKKKEGDKG